MLTRTIRTRNNMQKTCKKPTRMCKHNDKHHMQCVFNTAKEYVS
ncbi:hypothetical protein HMPREF9231_0545 [Gardnerella vaginalis HMP9231]|nr:hypothetical protein HMPREF9231_0545 [Gardnerella vaginalis HMP9231]BAQ33502.1 hypothetical protein GAVG_0850 [Gardnerella vaginalis ATCC 14018 = JCM 11026]